MVHNAAEKPSDASFTTSSADTVYGESDSLRHMDIAASNPRGNSNTNQGVDVAAAEREFAELSRRLSRMSEKSHASQRISRQISRQQPGQGKDVEKDVNVHEEEAEVQGGVFDLEAYLRGTESKEREAGIKPKRIGRF